MDDLIERVKQLKAQLSALQAAAPPEIVSDWEMRARRAEAFIARFQWQLSSSGNGRESCPHCAKWREYGHAETCPVGVILRKAAAPAPDGWRDIDSAPKDEKRVLLFNPDEGNFGWGIQTGAYYEQLGGWQYDGQNPRYSNAHPPTLWMPLPPLPLPPSAAPVDEKEKTKT